MKTEKSQTIAPDESLERLGELLKNIQYCMLTSVEKDGALRSRPMYTLNRDFDGKLWFFTANDSGKVEEIQTDTQVNLSYVSTDQRKFVSVSGKAAILQDRGKMADFWHPTYRAWFPGGVEDPNLRLICVEVDHAEYWESPSTFLARLSGLAMQVIGSDTNLSGDNQKIQVAK